MQNSNTPQKTCENDALANNAAQNPAHLTDIDWLVTIWPDLPPSVQAAIVEQAQAALRGQTP
ncbi:MAG: hypothetical protein BIFFINMI_02712 [Phycisphaerae bacterium]|nr:hypothetical protein [Phycisphaerae bacterium]